MKEKKTKAISKYKDNCLGSSVFGSRWTVNHVNKGNCRHTLRRLFSFHACLFHLFLYFFGSQNI